MKSKLKKVLRVATLGIAAAGILSVGQNAAAMGHEDVEINASVGIANMYLWRGLDVSGTDATAAVSGSLSVALKPVGFYFGVWGSSGWNDGAGKGCDTDDDATTPAVGCGAEYDLFIGWGKQWGLFGLDISGWTYVYPESKTASNDPGKLSDIVLSLSFTPEDKGYGFGLAWYQNVTQSSNEYYYTGSVDLWMFSILVGYNNGTASGDNDYTHANVTYSYNKNLNFTVSQVFQKGDGATAIEERPKFVVS